MGDGRVGVFATLTNSYALVATGGSMNFYRFGPTLPRVGDDRLIEGVLSVFSRPNWRMLFLYATLPSQALESSEG